MQAVWLVLVTNSLFFGSPIIHIFYIIGTKRCQFALGHAKLAMRISYSLSPQPPLPSPSKHLMSNFDHSGEHCFRSVPHVLGGKGYTHRKKSKIPPSGVPGRSCLWFRGLEQCWDLHQAAESFLENIILTQLTPLGMIFPAKFSYLEHLGKL